MEATDRFDLKAAVDRWLEINCPANEFTPANVLEMQDQIYSAIEELMEENGLSDEEAFAVAKIRAGDSEDWQGEMKQVNEDNFQLRKVVLLFGGVLLYFILYHLVICLSELFYVWLDYYNDAPVELNILRVKNFVISSYFLVAMGVVALFIMDEKTTDFLSNYKFTPLKIIFAFILLFVLFFVGRYFNFEIKRSLTGKEWGLFFILFNRLSYIFPVIFGIGFITLFFRYKKKIYLY